MKKILLGSGIAVALTLGTIAFTGGETIESVKGKVNEMFDSIGKYEANENILANRIRDLRDEKDELTNQMKNLTDSNEDKNSEIAGLNLKIEELNKKIKELEEQLASSGLASEVVRLEGEVAKSNEKVSELQSIIDRQAAGDPLTDSELDELFGYVHAGTINLSPDMVDGTEIQLTDYAKATLTRGKNNDGETIYKIIVEATKDFSFIVEYGCNAGSAGDFCEPGNTFEIWYGLEESDNGQYIVINNQIKYSVKIVK